MMVDIDPFIKFYYEDSNVLKFVKLKNIIKDRDCFFSFLTNGMSRLYLTLEDKITLDLNYIGMKMAIIHYYLPF